MDFQWSQTEVLALFWVARSSGMDGLADHELVTFAALLGSAYTPQRSSAS